MSATAIKVHGFSGGLHLNDHKNESTGRPIRAAALPSRIILPLQQHIGAPAKPLVEVGDYVYRGQMVAEPDGYVSTPVHASTSGTVVAIGPQPVAHPSGLTGECIVIECDGKDVPLAEPALKPIEDYTQLDPNELRDRVRQAGVVGLGGAAFPSFIKLNPGPGAVVDTLILNGAECEPYITCDQMLMAERASEIVQGAKLILFAVRAPRCLIGVEDNKPESIAALRDAVEDLGDPRIRVVELPTRYPQGGEKQLVQTLTGKEVPSEGLPLDIGIVCHNVGTAVAVWRAVTKGEPLISRVVTITGAGVAEPANLEVRLGTPVNELLEQCGGLKDPNGRLIMGGPMMGFALKSEQVPVIKATNCILAAQAQDVRPQEAAMPCIRCGDCVEVCPANLLPQQLYWHARAEDFDRAQDYQLFDCIECGCCAQVCPSHIPLVQYYRFAKSEIWAAEKDKRKSNHARERHEFKQARVEREEAEKQARLAAKKAAIKKPKTQEVAAQSTAAPADDPVAAAIAKAKAKASNTADNGDKAQVTDPVVAAIAKAKAKAADKTSQADNQASSPAEDPVAAAIARAKAKAESKADAKTEAKQSQQQTAAAAATTAAPADDPVAAAIAKAKAKAAAKQAAQEDNNADKSETPVAQSSQTDDPVAAAIAKAKAKAAAKQAAQGRPDNATEGRADKPADADDPVAAAIAKAKAKAAAKKAAQENTADAGDKPAKAEAPDNDPVAAAIAKAKAKAAAKKAAQSQDSSDPENKP
ncbi:MAG: electron transport complex subunit RsxC [Nevskiales bacterium]